jgi:lysozyme
MSGNMKPLLLILLSLLLFACDEQQKTPPAACPQDCTISNSGLVLLKQFEGFVPYVYKDAAGLPTIGYGHLIKEGESFTTITPKEAEELLKRDVKEAENAVKNLVRVPINQHQFDALVSFTFNVGAGNLRDSTLLKLLNDGKTSEVPEQFNRWVYAGGQKLTGLVLRRKAEAMLFG